jgi:hypothetical protein
LEINKEGKTAIFTAEDGKIYSLSQTADKSVMLYNTFQGNEISEPLSRFNVNIAKLVKAVNCLKKTDNLTEFNILNNSLFYQDDVVKFHIRLLSDSVMEVPKINISQVENFKSSAEIFMDSGVLSDIRRALDFSSLTKKFYIETEDNKLYFLFGDKEDSNMYDDIRVLISENFSGTIPSSIFSINILKLIERTRNDVVFKIGQQAMIAKITNENSVLQYITTSLKK